MKKLKEILIKHFPHLEGYKEWDIFENYDYKNKRYITIENILYLMKDVVEDALNEAAENAEILPEPKDCPDLWQHAKVDKESIKYLIDKYL
jgi:hypothetical protein